MIDYTDIIARLEKATGPDRNLDYDIDRKRGFPVNKRLTPYYTESIDSAATLVPKGLWWTCGCDADLTPCAVVGDSQCAEVGNNPAIALCIAALKAIAAQVETAKQDACDHVTSKDD